MLARRTAHLAMTAGFAFFLGACAGSSSSNEEITAWADAYCSTAGSFIRGFMRAGTQPAGGRSASYSFVLHYRRTLDAAREVADLMMHLDVPPEAQGVHAATLLMLNEVGTIVEDGIRDVENASDDALFQAAIGRYASRLSEQTRRLGMVAREGEPRVRERIAACL